MSSSPKPCSTETNCILGPFKTKAGGGATCRLKKPRDRLLTPGTQPIDVDFADMFILGPSAVFDFIGVGHLRELFGILDARR